MPLYEFHCSSCRKDSEILVRSTDWKGTKCPHCGSTKLAKKLSVFAASSGGGNGGGDGECAYPGACAMPSGKGKGRGRSHGGGCPCCH
jgi:putative FmdB family regulatory protein